MRIILFHFMGYFFIFIPFFQLYKYLGVLVKHSFIILTLGLLITTLSGCATSRGLIQVPTPHNPTSYQEVANSKKVVIALVEDDRTFEDKPATADIPSLKDGLAKATEADKAKAVARKRNGYGKALGDILLEKETVSELLQKRTTLALERSGYVVLENNETNRANADFVLNIKINKFWSWFQPGFASIKIHSEIDTDISNTKNLAAEPVHVYSKVVKSAQVANGTKWIENIDNVLNDYETKLISSLTKVTP